MKANELRIGNWVLFSEDSTVFKVKSIEENWLELHNEEETSWISSEELGPIPLTEEWLLMFGFTRHHADYYNDVILLKDVINFDNGEQYDCLKVKIYPHELGSAQSVKGDLQIKHVHQLQNLYFALTGEELTK